MPAGARKKIGVVSHVLPPSPSGQAMVLYRLLSGLPSAEFCLISSGRKSSWDDCADSERLDADLFYLRKVAQLPPVKWAWLTVLFTCINTVWGIFWRSREIETLARRECCDALIACTGDFYDLPATFIACRRLGIAFVPYIFDDYAYQWLGFKRRVAKLIEPIMLKRAKAVIVPNEFLQQEYLARHSVETVVIHNPCTLPDLRELDKKPQPFKEGFNIVYTGAIYHAHYDAFVNLVAALHRLGNSDVRLHLYTAQAEKELTENGITGPFVVYHRHVPQKEIYPILRQADLLFLPLAFDSPIPEVIKTSAPGKTGEYLAVGTLVLVHAPKDSYLSWYFQSNRCGVVVNSHDPNNLYDALHEITANPATVKAYAQQGRKMAETDFELEMARIKFMHVLQEI